MKLLWIVLSIFFCWIFFLLLLTLWMWPRGKIKYLCWAVLAGLAAAVAAVTADSQ